MDVTKIGVTRFVLAALILQLKIHHQKNVMKVIVMIIEDNKHKQCLVQLVRNGQLKPLKFILELQKNIQILVLVTIINVETLMAQKEFGVIRLTQI